MRSSASFFFCFFVVQLQLELLLMGCVVMNFRKANVGRRKNSALGEWEGLVLPTVVGVWYFGEVRPDHVFHVFHVLCMHFTWVILYMCLALFCINLRPICHC